MDRVFFTKDANQKQNIQREDNGTGRKDSEGNSKHFRLQKAGKKKTASEEREMEIFNCKWRIIIKDELTISMLTLVIYTVRTYKWNKLIIITATI